MGTTQDAFIAAFEVQLAMWADENLFGHGLDDEEYEDLCASFADDLEDRAFQVLQERPVR